MLIASVRDFDGAEMGSIKYQHTMPNNMYRYLLNYINIYLKITVIIYLQIFILLYISTKQYKTIQFRSYILL